MFYVITGKRYWNVYEKVLTLPNTVPPKQSFTICAQYCEKLCTVVRFLLPFGFADGVISILI